MSSPAVPVTAPAGPPGGAPPAVQALLTDLHQLPGQRPALLRVVQIADDPDCSVRRLADAAASDPAFTARLLQLANSAYYGRSGRVTAIVPAVSVLGAETLRGLAVTMALGLAGEHGSLPDGFWERASATAAGSRLVAPRVGADSGDAFCVGLLREVGQALLFRAAPEPYSALLADRDGVQLAVAERQWCGTTSGELAAAALRAAGLPESVCEAIASHQRYADAPATALGPLARALRAGVVLARAVGTGEVDDGIALDLEEAVGGQLDPSTIRELALRTAAQAAALSATMS